MRNLIFGSLLSLILAAASVHAQSPTTLVPGHDTDKYDQDQNGYPDAGVNTTGHYVEIFAFDLSGGLYWLLGDGTLAGTVGSLDDLDPATTTLCYYHVNYRGKFENDPFLDSGWIMTNRVCTGYFNGTANELIVHSSDPRYTGNPDWVAFGDWEYQTLTQSGLGNAIRGFSNPSFAIGAR